MALPEGWVGDGEQIESGQAFVYAARRPEVGDGRFALKRLKNESRRDRFAREVRTMERLLNEYGAAVPPIVAKDLADRRPWFAMPWYESGSLQAKVEAGGYRSEPGAGLELLIRLAGILADVHTAGVAHRDLKPANVLIDGARLVLSDFGLCFEADEPGTRLTRAGEAIGSRLYIAPENESGINEDVDQNPADFYAFGKLAWAVLSGADPPAREDHVAPENRLVTRIDHSALGVLDELLVDLARVDPRARLGNWDVVLAELRATVRAVEGMPTTEIRSPGEQAMRVAERLDSLSGVRAWREADDDERRRRLWIDDLFNSMRERARLADRALEKLQGPIAEYLTLSATTGGPPPSWLLALNEATPLGIETAAEALSSSAGAHDAAVVFLIHSPRGIEALPTLTVRVWCVNENDSIRIVRVPTVVRGREPERIADFLGPTSIRSFGPYPMFRQTTVDQAAAIVEETAQIFVAVCEAYLIIAGAELDPSDPQSWLGHDIHPAPLIPVTEPAHDVDAPTLRSFSLTPTNVRLSDGGEVVCRARIVDDLAGNAGDGYASSPSQALLVSQTGQTKVAMLDVHRLISGTPRDGKYEDRLYFEQAAERGPWRVQHVMLVDQVGNTRTYSPAQLADLGFTHTIVLV